MKFILSPPLRNVRQQDKLWCGISDGAIDVVATDHCTFSMAQRPANFLKANSVAAQMAYPVWKTACSYCFSSGVMTGRITPERFVELTSAMPARLFGLWPQKGLLAPGSDGDVVIIDPRQRPTNSASPSPRQRRLLAIGGFYLSGRDCQNLIPW